MRTYEVVYGVTALVALIASIVRVYAWHTQKKDMETMSMYIFIIALCVIATIIAIESIDPNQKNTYIICALVVWIITSMILYTWIVRTRSMPEDITGTGGLEK